MDSSQLSYSSSVDAIEASSRQLNPLRQQLLLDAAQQMHRVLAAAGQLNLLFVCTHNSRRSQLSEVWAAVAAEHYSLPRVNAFSCGTEATECNPRTVASLRRIGFELSGDSATANPVYQLHLSNQRTQQLFSKAFGHASLPTHAIAAMMCCDDADQNCPVVPGAELRVPLHYQDPKRSDDTAEEEATYDRRSREIGAEMFFLLRQLSQRT